jgi:hypothetical protein
LTSAAESFVVALARASKRAKRHLRGLDPASRDDVLATAILWCWEHKADYDPSVALEDWFLGAIRNARKSFEAGESRNAAELVPEMVSADDPVTHAEAIQAVEIVARALSPEEGRVADLMVAGYSRTEIRGQLGQVANDTLAAIRARLDALKPYIPDSRELRRVMRHARTPPAMGSDDHGELAPIDREIERLEFAPPAGADCPPCWRCQWFDGFMPGPHRPVRMPIVEPAVRDAVRDTEARKLEIAQKVRDKDLLLNEVSNEYRV